MIKDSLKKTISWVSYFLIFWIRIFYKCNLKSILDDRDMVDDFYDENENNFESSVNAYYDDE